MEFIKSNQKFRNFLMLSRSVADMPGLTMTEKMIYARLHDRCKVSQKNKWVDEESNVYIMYTIESLAKDMGLKQSAIKKALKDLEENDLIMRQHQGLGLPNRIYVKAPLDFLSVDDTSMADGQPEKYLPDRQKSTCLMDKKVATSNNNNNKTNYIKNEQNKGRTPYGRYKNVMLTEDEYRALKQNIPEADKYIQDLSCYMQSKGVSYPDHDATIRNWYRRDQDKQSLQSASKAKSNKFNDFPQRDYDIATLERELLKYGTN